MTPRNPINSNYEALGFETMYALLNLGTMLLFLLLFPALALLDVLLICFQCKYPVILRKKLKKELYWNSTITFFKECYLVAIMCALINLKAFTFDTPGEIASSSLSIVFMVLSIVIPILLAFKIYKNFSKLADSSF